MSDRVSTMGKSEELLSQLEIGANGVGRELRSGGGRSSHRISVELKNLIVLLGELSPGVVFDEDPKPLEKILDMAHDLLKEPVGVAQGVHDVVVITDTLASTGGLSGRLGGGGKAKSLGTPVEDGGQWITKRGEEGGEVFS